MSRTELIRPTTAGPVTGFEDTLPQRQETRYTGQNGDEPAIAKWLGIPYGYAPRFGHVGPAEKWSQPLECYDYGPMPPQPSSFFNQIMVERVKGHISRDHLVQADEGWETVNIYAPPGTKAGDKLPVLCWIYGGSLNNGSSGLYTGDPTNWLRRSIRDGKPFILVSGNYRTNIFGFLASEDLRNADSSGLAGNYGLRDCLAIFQWIQDNIEAFGGDSANVTGHGESAGAYLISQLLFVNANPSVKKRRIMRRAIMQSGAPATLGAKRLHDAYPRYDQMLKDLGIEGATPRERIDALRLVPFTELLAYGVKHFELGMWTTTIEEGPHAIWSQSTVAQLERGEFDDSIESVIIGTNEHEGSLFSTQTQSPEAYQGIISRVPEAIRATVEKLYPAPSGKGGIADSPSAQIFGDRIFEAACHRMAECVSKRTPTYVYRLRGAAQAILDGLQCGVVHTADLHVLFNLSNYWTPDSDDAKLAKTLGDAWVDFATSGKFDIDWKPFEADQPSWLVFKQDGSTENESIADYKKDKLELWTATHVKSAQRLAS